MSENNAENNGNSGDGNNGAGDTSNASGDIDHNALGFGGLDSVVRDNLANDGIKDYAALVKQFTDQKSHLGNSIRIPSDDASDADKKTFYDRLQEKVPTLIPKPNREDKEAWDALQTMLGRPDAAKDYTHDDMEGVDTSRIENFRNQAHELGLTQTQFEAIVKSDFEGASEANRANKETHEADLTELAKDWGVTYEKRVTDIINFAKRTGAPDDLLALLENKSIGSGALKWFHTLTKNVSGGAEIRTQAPGGTDDVAPAEALARARECMGKLAEMKPSDPQYQALHEKRDRYMEMAYPDAAKGLSGLRANQS